LGAYLGLRTTSIEVFRIEQTATASRVKKMPWGSKRVRKRKLPTAQPIERRAYDLRLEQGCEDDYDVADWVAPERKLTESSGASVLRRPAKLDRA
jgi:hypothetical protein